MDLNKELSGPQALQVWLPVLEASPDMVQLQPEMMLLGKSRVRKSFRSVQLFPNIDLLSCLSLTLPCICLSGPRFILWYAGKTFAAIITTSSLANWGKKDGEKLKTVLVGKTHSGAEITDSVIKAASCLLLAIPLQLIKYRQTLFFCPAIFTASVCSQLTPCAAHFNSFNVSQFQSMN